MGSECAGDVGAAFRWFRVELLEKSGVVARIRCFDKVGRKEAVHSLSGVSGRRARLFRGVRQHIARLRVLARRLSPRSPVRSVVPR